MHLNGDCRRRRGQSIGTLTHSQYDDIVVNQLGFENPFHAETTCVNHQYKSTTTNDGHELVKAANHHPIDGVEKFTNIIIKGAVDDTSYLACDTANQAYCTVDSDSKDYSSQSSGRLGLGRRSSSFLDGFSASMDRFEQFGVEPPSPSTVYRHLYDRERLGTNSTGGISNKFLSVDEGLDDDVEKSPSRHTDNYYKQPSEPGNARRTSLPLSPPPTSQSTNNTTAARKTEGKSSAYEQAQLLLVSLLENFCALYDRNPDKNRRLFMALCKQLWNMGILTSADFFSRSEKLRGVYKEAFRTLVLQAIEGIEAAEGVSGVKLLTRDGEAEERLDSPSRDDASSPLSIVSSSTSSHNNPSLCSSRSLETGAWSDDEEEEAFKLKPVTSRLETEFRNLQLIGRGGFAQVFRGEHRIDYCQYAFKRIEFKSKSSDSYAKIIREIKSLAHLDHPFIVRYHGAWIEERPRAAAVMERHRRHRRFSAHSLDVNFDVKMKMSFEGSTSVSQATYFPSITLGDNNTGSMGIDVPLGNGASEFEVLDEHPSGYFMIIQMELCQFTLADWIEQRNFLVRYGKNWRPEYGPRQSRTRPTIPSDCMAMLAGGGEGGSATATWDINPAENCRIFKCIVKAIQHIHTKGIIHRDLKPGNILFQVDGDNYTPKIGDFGLASDISLAPTGLSSIPTPAPPFPDMAVEEGGLHRRSSSLGNNLLEYLPSPSLFSSRSTRTTGLGTSTYAAPEQIRDSEYDEKVDIYSLGIILFELFHPFATRMERQDVLEDLKKGIFPATFVKRWPKEATLIWSCISPNAEMRPSAEQILESEILEQDPEETVERLALENSTLKKLLEAERERARNLQERLLSLSERTIDSSKDVDDCNQILLEELKAFRLP